MSCFQPAPSSDTELTAKLFDALVAGDRIAVDRLLASALETMSPLDSAVHVVAPTLNRIGDAWSQGNLALAQVYLAGRICEDRVDQLLMSTAGARKDSPRLGIAVLSDHHTLGKRIVTSCIRAAGYELTDYGAAVEPEVLAARVCEDGLDAILVSTLMLHSALKVQQLTALLSDHPAKVFVGGAPFLFDPDLWQVVGADGMGHNAADGVKLVQNLKGAS